MSKSVHQQLLELEKDSIELNTKRTNTMNQHERLSRSIRRFVVYPVGTYIFTNVLINALEASIYFMMYGTLVGGHIQ